MKININAPEGNIFEALGIASKLLRDAGRSNEDIRKLQDAVFQSKNYDEACAAITKATYGSIEFEK